MSRVDRVLAAGPVARVLVAVLASGAGGALAAVSVLAVPVVVRWAAAS